MSRFKHKNRHNNQQPQSETPPAAEQAVTNSQTLFSKHKYIIGLVLFYFLIRFINLTLIPIFNDESIYIDWGWRSLHLGVPFYSLYDGKQPLLIWLFSIARNFISDPLAAARSISVITGSFSLIGLYLIGKKIFNEKVGLIAALFYIFIPIFSFFDRQALMESAVAASEIWVIYLFINVLKKQSTISASVLGIVMGIGFFIKSTILLTITSTIFAYSYLFRFKQDNKEFWKNIAISLLISQIVLLPLYMQSLFWKNLSMNDRYTLTLSEILKFPILTWLNNFWIFLQISFWHLTPLVFIATIGGIIITLREKDKYQKLIALIFILQIILMSLAARNLIPRYVMPTLPVSTLLVAFSITYFKKWSKLLIAILIIIPAYLTLLQITNPLTYFDQLDIFTKYSDKNGYVTSFTSGYATQEAINYINNLNIPAAFVTIRLDAGNPENAVESYFHDSKRRVPNYLESRLIKDANRYECLTFRFPLYFVSRDYQLAGLERFLVEEKRFYNPGKKSSVGVYKLKSPCQGTTLDLSAPGAILQPAHNQ